VTGVTELTGVAEATTDATRPVDIAGLPAYEVTSGGCPISYRVVGEGPPLLLVMGLGADVTAWADHVPTFAPRWRCILVDNRGVGRSGRPAGPYSTAQMADDCAEVLRAAAAEPAAVPAAVIGISMGGAIAQELALRHPDLVRAVVLVSTWARCDGYLAEVFDHLRTAHAVLGPVEFTQLLQLRTWGPAYVSGHLGELRDARLVAAGAPVADDAFAAQSAACISHATLDRLCSIHVPTLVTVGHADCFTVLARSEEIHRAISGSRLEVFPGGHTHHWEQLEAFNALTSAWLDSLGPVEGPNGRPNGRPSERTGRP
jgi:pimeloyl-ACP methyl ester carboxylesterase